MSRGKCDVTSPRLRTRRLRCMRHIIVLLGSKRPKSTDNSLLRLQKKSLFLPVNRPRPKDIRHGASCPPRGDSWVCVVRHRQNTALADTANSRLIFTYNHIHAPTFEVWRPMMSVEPHCWTSISKGQTAMTSAQDGARTPSQVFLYSLFSNPNSQTGKYHMSRIVAILWIYFNTFDLDLFLWKNSRQAPKKPLLKWRDI